MKNTILLLVSLIMITGCSDPMNGSSFYLAGAKEKIKEKDYKKAGVLISKITEQDEEYREAQLLKHHIDSALLVINNKELKIRLANNIKNFKDITSKTDRSSGVKLSAEIGLLMAWTKDCDDARQTNDSEMKKLADDLMKKVATYQNMELRNIRVAYGELLRKSVWEQDIEVRVFGKNKNYIEFVGGLFAANKNKKAFITEIHETLLLYRFKQARFKWYKGEDEYTFYDLSNDTDSKPFDYSNVRQ